MRRSRRSALNAKRRALEEAFACWPWCAHEPIYADAGVDETSGRQPLQEATRAGVSRLRILQLVRESPGGLGVHHLGERVGLHANTVRFHLDRLVAEGLMLRHAEARTEPGRPRLSFTATARPDTERDQRSYPLLAQILAGHIADAVPDAAATEAGRTWGRYLTERRAPYRTTSEEEAVTELLRTLDEVGFAPELYQDEPHDKVLLRHCPFLEAAELTVRWHAPFTPASCRESWRNCAPPSRLTGCSRSSSRPCASPTWPKPAGVERRRRDRVRPDHIVVSPLWWVCRFARQRLSAFAGAPGCGLGDARSSR